MVDTDIKIYEYKRGEKYKVLVRVVEGLCIFEKITCPSDATVEVQEKLLEEAEREALKLHEKEA